MFFSKNNNILDDCSKFKKSLIQKENQIEIK